MPHADVRAVSTSQTSSTQQSFIALKVKKTVNKSHHVETTANQSMQDQSRSQEVLDVSHIAEPAQTQEHNVEHRGAAESQHVEASGTEVMESQRQSHEKLDISHTADETHVANEVHQTQAYHTFSHVCPLT